MAQTLVVYLIVAAAAGWVVWSVILPSALKRTLKRGGKDCGCDGGCGPTEGGG